MTRTIIFMLAALTVAGVTRALAQETPGVAAPPTAKGAVIRGKAPVAHDILQVKLPRPQEFTLSNGLRVFVLENHKLPTVTLSLSVRAGTLFEPKPGVADLTASLLDEGTATRTATQFALETETLGANFGANAGSERTTLSISGLSSSTDQLTEILADALLHPAFPEDRLARVKFQTRARLAQARSNPTTLAAELAAKVFYGDTPYARVNPTPEQVDAVTRADLTAFHAAFYQPRGAILGITGDVKARDIVKKFETLLADWKATGEAAPLPTAAFAPKTATRIFLIDRPGSAQTVLSWGNIALARADPDYIPLVVADRILGGGASGRLFASLREDKGYTYGAYSRLSAPRWPGTWGASASVRTPVTAPAVGAFLDEFARLQTSPVSADELDRAKRALVGSFARTLESPEGILSRTLELVQNDLPLDYWDKFPARVQAVTADDVERVARKYLGEKRIQLIAVGERSAVESGLAKYGTVEIVEPGGTPTAK